MGLNISVFRSDGIDCTNGGVSANANRLCVVNVDGPFSPSEDVPAVRLVPGPLNTVVLIPADATERRLMFGGNFGYTSDSRFSKAVRRLNSELGYLPIAIHDRTE